MAEDEPHCFLLESVERGEQIGRYTFLGARPYMRVWARGNEVTVEGEGTVKDDDTSDLEPRAAAIATMATSTPAARRLRIRIRRVVARAGSL